MKKKIWIMVCLFIGLASCSTLFFDIKEGRYKDETLVETSVMTKAGLISALNAGYKRIIIPPYTTIDMGAMAQVLVPEGTQIYGQTNEEGELTSQIHASVAARRALFLVKGKDVVFRKLIISGIHLEIEKDAMKKAFASNSYYKHNHTIGIKIDGGQALIDSCEMFGWSNAAINVVAQGNATVQYCSIHHNRRHGLGYGISVGNGNSIVQYCNFDYNRHDIASSGVVGSRYRAIGNFVGPNGNGHSFDVHGGKDRKDGTDVAGDDFLIKDNVFTNVREKPILVRGTPRRQIKIINNQWPAGFDINKFYRGDEMTSKFILKNNTTN